MGENSKIEWCHHTFNAWEGCMKVSPACANCYAEDRDKRWHGGIHWGPNSDRKEMSIAYWKQPLKWDRDAANSGQRARVFCSSLSDVFEDHPTANFRRSALWGLIANTPNLDWLLLTKRPENIKRFLPADWHYRYGRPNVWLGTTVENQEYADKRIPLLAEVGARVHFLSVEPMLGPIHLRDLRTLNIQWTICGGESGKNARPMHPDWARHLRDLCLSSHVPFFFKQWGEYADLTNEPDGSALHQKSTVDLIFTASNEYLGAGYREGKDSKGMVESDWKERGGAWMGRVGKKSAGRLLDGQEWSQFPNV